jgi:hypothetical protein
VHIGNCQFGKGGWKEGGSGIIDPLYPTQESDRTLSLEQAEKHYREWVIGVIMLSLALLISSYLAICQERMYKNYGQHPREAMFYTVSFSKTAKSLPLEH